MKTALKILAVDDNLSISRSMPFIFAAPFYDVTNALSVGLNRLETDAQKLSIKQFADHAAELLNTIAPCRKSDFQPVNQKWKSGGGAVCLAPDADSFPSRRKLNRHLMN